MGDFDSGLFRFARCVSNIKLIRKLEIQLGNACMDSGKLVRDSSWFGITRGIRRALPWKTRIRESLDWIYIARDRASELQIGSVLLIDYNIHILWRSTWGRFWMKLWMLAPTAAWIISSIGTSRLLSPYAIFSRMLQSKRIGSCETIPIWDRNHCRLMSSILQLSKNWKQKQIKISRYSA